MKLYRSYMFRAKDPVIDQLRTQLQDKLGRRQIDHADLKEIEDTGGPSAACMAKWYWGETKRPQNATVEAAGRAMGLMRVWVPLRLKEDVKREPIKQKEK